MALPLSTVALPARGDRRLAAAADSLFPRPRTFRLPPRTRLYVWLAAFFDLGLLLDEPLPLKALILF